MGTFRYTIQVGPLDGSRMETLEALVDTGATYTRIPRPIRERLSCWARLPLRSSASLPTLFTNNSSP